MGEKLDTWGKWKREAIRDYDRASSEYLHNKSLFEKYSDELKRAKIMSKLPWYKRWGIKGIAWQSKINRHGMAILSEMGGSAAQLAPDSWKGVAFDLGTLGIGAAAGAVGKIAKLGKLGKLGRLGGAMRPTTFKALQDMHKAAGFPKIARSAAQVQKARIDRMEKIIRSAEAVDKATYVVHAGHMIEKSGKTLVNTLTKPRTPISPTKTTLRPRPPLPNIAGQIRVTLPQPQHPELVVRQKAGKSRSLPPLNRIKGLPKFKGGFVPGPKIGDIFKSKYMDKMRKYVPPLRPHKPSVPPSFKHVPGKATPGARPFNWKSNAIPPKHLQSTFRPDRPGQPGWGQDIHRSRPFNWKSNAIPPKHLQSTFRPDRPGQPGWGQEIHRSRPFNWKSNAIPPKHLQSTFRPDRPGQPGWGQEVSRSRPVNPLRNMWQQGNRFSPLTPQPVQKRISAPPMRPFQSNPLRQMSQGLMNPNRARPMFR